jgi:hypothetical protein
MIEKHDGTSASATKASISGIGCLAGIATAIVVPAFVFVAILIANANNPNCGTPGDSGGCEMGLASGTIAAVFIGLMLGAWPPRLRDASGGGERRAHASIRTALVV